MPCYSPCHVSPYCHPAARAQSSFSLREAAFWDVQKEHHHRAPVVQGPLGSDWIAVLGMDGRLLQYWHGVGGSMFNSSLSAVFWLCV